MKHCLFRLLKKEHYYQINPIFDSEEHYVSNKMLWLVIKSVPGQRYSLQEKDIIKLGKQKIRIREIVQYDPNPSMVADFNDINVSKAVYEDLSLKTHVEIP